MFGNLNKDNSTGPIWHFVLAVNIVKIIFTQFVTTNCPSGVAITYSDTLSVL